MSPGLAIFCYVAGLFVLRGVAGWMRRRGRGDDLVKPQGDSGEVFDKKALERRKIQVLAQGDRAVPVGNKAWGWLGNRCTKYEFKTKDPVENQILKGRI